MLYRCRDGQYRRATVHAADLRAQPARYVISVDSHVTGIDADASCLSPTPPGLQPPSTASHDAPSPPETSAAATPPAFQRHQSVWYSGPAAYAPCRAWIEAVGGDGEYKVILQGDDRETTAFQLRQDLQSSATSPDAAPPPTIRSEPPPSRAALPLTELELVRESLTVREADLFNCRRRILIVNTKEQSSLRVALPSLPALPPRASDGDDDSDGDDNHDEAPEEDVCSECEGECCMPEGMPPPSCPPSPAANDSYKHRWYVPLTSTRDMRHHVLRSPYALLVALHVSSQEVGEGHAQ